jgi:C-terminal processing protease CtpA/Prc
VRATAPCERTVDAGYATGLVGTSRPDAYSGKPWGRLVFNAAQYAYHDGVWSGAVITLVDQETWSAAEEFAALMQDNGIGVVLGTRTGGAGCGHFIDRAPVILTHSKAALNLPDCIRFRRDGSNEVNGVIPDITIASRLDDSLSFKAKLIEAALPAAVDMAIDRNRQSGRAKDR